MKNGNPESEISDELISDPRKAVRTMKTLNHCFFGHESSVHEMTGLPKISSRALMTVKVSGPNKHFMLILYC